MLRIVLVLVLVPVIDVHAFDERSGVGLVARSVAGAGSLCAVLFGALLAAATAAVGARAIESEREHRAHQHHADGGRQQKLR